jgi:hypothetical protein
LPRSQRSNNGQTGPETLVLLSFFCRNSTGAHGKSIRPKSSALALYSYELSEFCLEDRLFHRALQPCGTLTYRQPRSSQAQPVAQIVALQQKSGRGRGWHETSRLIGLRRIAAEQKEALGLGRAFGLQPLD